MKSKHDQKVKRKPTRSRRRYFILLSVILLGSFLLTYHFLNRSQSCVDAPSPNYTADEVMSAYEAGQFSTLLTGSNRHIIVQDGEYLLSYSGAIYQLCSQGYVAEIGRGNLDPSPDGEYVASSNGVYRVDDGEPIIPYILESFLIPDHIAHTGYITYSPDSQYVGIGGAGRYRAYAPDTDTNHYGVYRLSDGEQIVQSDSYGMSFDGQSDYVSTDEGIYRLRDGVLISDTPAVISPDSQYVYRRGDGVYQIESGVQVIDGSGDRGYFAPDEEHIIIEDDGIYRLDDRQRLVAVPYRLTDLSRPFYSPDNSYVLLSVYIYEVQSDDTLRIRESRNQIYRLADGELLFDTPNQIALSPDWQTIVVDDDGIYQVADGRKLGSLDNSDGAFYTHFSSDRQYVSVYNDGTYRMSDGQQVSEYYGLISHDNAYIAVGDDGVYRISDGEKLFDIAGYARAFTADNNYLQVYGYDVRDTGIYRISDGHFFPHLRIVDIEQGILAVANTFLVVDESAEDASINIIVLENSTPMYRSFGDDSTQLFTILSSTVLTVYQHSRNWHQVSYRGETGWIQIEDAELLTIP